ncbi:MAG TPA: BTAD domain-containing putative transcriptional regulator, partial [Thermoanaerobaculia bacterium]|nr:BTAD domain-containing putative transcriptional regulator [Thermoanaerobaculia bacterium]
MRNDLGALVTISAKKSQALLAYLGIKPSQRMSREKIATVLWSSTGPDQARQSLRQTLSTLRRELTQIAPEEKLLIEEGDLLGLNDALVECDAASFEMLVAMGTEEALIKAAELYRGDFLDGFSINEERFDQWVLGERDRLHRMALRAHTALIDAQTRRGAIDDAIATGQRSLRLDVLQEAVHRTLMRLYMQSGDLVNALQQYELLAKVLKRELRVEPDAETRAVHKEIVAIRSKINEQAKA